MAASARAILLLSRFRDLSPSPSSPSIHFPLSLRPPFSRHLLLRRWVRQDFRSHASPVSNCLVSGVDGGGVSDDFVSTLRSGSAQFSALASVLRRIEPLDTSVIGKGVTASAKDSMKRTISTMLGLLPSDQFRVSIRISSQRLHQLLASSIITGYTLWNAEYRVSLMRNFENSPGSSQVDVDSLRGSQVLREVRKERVDGEEVQDIVSGVEMTVPKSLGVLSPLALSYIQELESELATAEKELSAQKQEDIHRKHSEEDNNDLLEYLRSLEPDVVSELSQPSSSEIEDIIGQLVQSIHQRFMNDNSSHLLQDSDMTKSGAQHDNSADDCDAMITTRDYLAKLLLWCMLMGHHLRGLEYRLQLSCVVGLL